MPGNACERRLERLAALEVEVVRRLVEHEQVGAARDDEREPQPAPLAARERASTGFSCASQPEKRKRAEQLLRLGAAQTRRGDRGVEHRAALVELGLVLGEVGGLDAVARASTWPAAGSRRPSSVSSRVVLPEPFGPDQRDVLAPLERERRVVERAACRPPRGRAPPPRARSGPTAAGFRNSKPSVRRGRRAVSAMPALMPVDLLLLRLRLLRLRVLRAEALDEPLELGDLLGVALGASSPRAGRGRPARAARRATCPGKYTDRPRSSSSTAVVTASRNQRSWATRITAASIVAGASARATRSSRCRGGSSARRGAAGRAARRARARARRASARRPRTSRAAGRGRRR